ncbi:MAG: hypothetical protein ACE5GD_00470 [Candidatus Geothermarchaeales archaeon]
MKIKKPGKNPRKLKRIFFNILDGEVDKREGLEEARRFEGPWNRGYVLGMRSILELQRKQSLSLQLNPETPTDDLAFFHKRFGDLSLEKLFRSLDRGYFASWRDYVSYILSHRETSEKE